MGSKTRYQQEISRTHPGCIIFLLDQSASMNDSIGGTARSKKDALAKAINRFIRDLIFECLKGGGKPRHYFDIAVLGYCTDPEGQPIIGSAFQGPLAGRDIVSVVDLFDFPLREEIKEVDDGDGGLIQKRQHVWYDPAPTGGTPMMQGLQRCHAIAGDWVLAHPESFPPIVIHITDGESTDGDPEPVADTLRELATNDGPLLLFNCHLSERNDPPLVFPAYEFDIPGDDSQMLFRMSSPLPEKGMRNASAKGIPVSGGARGMVFNADSTTLIMLIQIGTQVGGNLR
jgi:hypothetical protein